MGEVLDSYSGIDSRLLMTPDEARKFYSLRENGGLFATEFDRELERTGIAVIDLPISESDFEELLDLYDQCIEEHPGLLGETAHKVDGRYGAEAGHERKNKKISNGGVQISDGKYIFHFNEYASRRWAEQFSLSPLSLSMFLEAGAELQQQLIAIVKQYVSELEETHPNISNSFFQPVSEMNPGSYSFLRLIRYDSYEASEQQGDIAKAHYDIGHLTVQAYADAEGFWGSKDGPSGQRAHYDTQEGRAYMFLGKGHSKIYGPNSRLKPLYHGVERIIPEGVSKVPERRAVILFVDCPLIDPRVSARDTLPYLSQKDNHEAVGY